MCGFTHACGFSVQLWRIWSAALVYLMIWLFCPPWFLSTVMSDSFTRFPVSVLEWCVHLVVHLFSLFSFFFFSLHYPKLTLIAGLFASSTNTHLRNNTFHFEGKLCSRLFQLNSARGSMRWFLITSRRFVEEVVVDPSSEEKGMFELPCCLKGSPYAG